MPHPIEPIVVLIPGTTRPVCLKPAVNYDPTDPLVVAYPDAFEQPEEQPKSRRGRRSVEQATAVPGQLR